MLGHYILEAVDTFCVGPLHSRSSGYILCRGHYILEAVDTFCVGPLHSRTSGYILCWATTF